MNINSMFPSKYVAAADLNGMEVPVEIARITPESMPEGESRPVVYFAGMQKGMVLNRTNAKRIEALHGSETNNWIGARIVLYPSETEFKGDTVPCIRVRGDKAPVQHTIPVQPQVPPQAPATLPQQPQSGSSTAVRF